jgi:hypothetical protein
MELNLGFVHPVAPVFNENHKSIVFVRNLSRLYSTQYNTYMFRLYSHLQVCYIYKNAKIILKHNESVNLLSK